MYPRSLRERGSPSQAASSRGFSLIEVLITAFVLATVTVAITGLGMLSARSAIESERQNVAQAIANEKIEIARTYSYAQIEFDDISPEGKIKGEEDVKRNDQEYIVYSYITLKDDPRNGTLPEGTELTSENADFKQLSVKVEWKRISGQEQSSTSSTVVAATFFANKAENNVCIPGTLTCLNPNGCVPGTPASCPDQTGDYTLDCPATGACAGEEPFAVCSPSGDCNEDPSPTPTPDDDDKPCSDDSQCGSEEACIDNKCQPGWCRAIGLGGGTAEVCSLEGCDDLQDNDGDGGIDVSGRDNDNNGRFDDQVDTPPDPQCAAIANEGGLFVWDGPCIRNDPYSATNCSGVQSGYEVAPTTSQCTLLKSCGMRRRWQRACTVPQCQSENACQEKRNCNNHQTCVDYDCFNDNECPAGQACNDGVCGGLGKCSLSRPVCLNGACFECTADNKENCKNIRPDRCDIARGGKDCKCYYATCVQCTSSRLNPNTNPDPDCTNVNKPYCYFGDCVAQCGNGIDDDKDGRTDFPNDPDCTSKEDNTEAPGPPPPSVTQCNDGVDNLDPEDVLVDGADPGCHTDCNAGNAGSYDATDNDETDVGPGCGGPPAPTPPLKTQCSDGLDNDGDFTVDLVDPGCFGDPNNNNEAAA